uniref:non-specific serine/threonine protein kinase n=1 Tax=Oryza nivara TaxID=4536 RepID=A0A0E0FIM7_ORYNI
MEKRSKEMFSLFSFVVIFLCLITNAIYSGSKFVHATDTLLPGKSLSGNQVLISKGGAFGLGFNCLSPPCYSDSTFGIWYIKSSTCRSLLVWAPVANFCIFNPWSSSFILSEDGKLNLIIDGSLSWSSNGVETSVSAVAILLDNGNLVIRDQVNSTMVFWQSFDNPIGILLPGGWLGFNRMTGKNVSLSSKYSTDGYDAYDTGNFILDINANEGRGFTINAPDFDSGNTYKIKYSGAFPRWMGVRADGGSFLLFNDADIYVQLYPDGNVTAAKLGDCGSVLYNAPHKQNVSFHPMVGVYKFPQNEWSMEVRSIRECEAACYSDCSCTSFAFNKTCLLWYGELQNTIVFDSRSEGYLMYMRVVEQKQEKSEYKVAIIVVTLKNATKGFSEKLGEGGFGCVFKGTLPGFSVVAVKKLKDLRQGEKQFRSEVQTIGMIQHINLVHLLGFCAEGSKRLLVYEYLVNGSLNSHLFSNYSAKLTWNLRYCIAHGIAKGLAYLHEECRHCIIHCDMKPDNVLLDAEFCPKIADFGMAKLLGRDFSRALTTMRGTIGYLAPEWISGLPITHKADVYCYGMMLLEIISGRRNSEKIKEGRHTYFPIYAACKVNEGDVMCLLDRRLDGNADAEQLEKACRIACWCIQDAEDHRPMMGQVVHMLEGVTDVEVPPVPRSLQYFVGMEDNNTQSAEFGCVEVGCPSGRSQDVRRNGSTTSGMPNCVSQSFDYPSDTILPGGGLGFNKIIGKNISLCSSDYYSTLEIDTRKNRGFIIRYIPCGWMFAGTFPSWMKFHEDGTSFLTFNNAQTYLSFDGLYISLNKLGECNYGSNNLWFYPENYFEYCGPYGHSCSSECECPLDNYKRYRVREHGIWGCSRLVPINCAKMMFYRIDGIDSFPDSPQFLTVRSIAECEAVCSSNCSCTAYAYDVTCLLWYGELWNATMQGSGSVGRHIYIRVGQRETSIKNSKRVNIAVLVTGISSLVIGIGLILLWRFHRKLFTTRSVDTNSGLMVFSYAEVKNTTKKFSEKLGEGGFGSVFKGTLPGCSVVAVKKLKCVVQVEKQFRSEVQTIGMIQQINLVRLLGFCAEERKRLLVYEYMPNGSLSSHLFSDDSEKLCWQLRYHIALGTARGLAYLHEECKDCIVHCDMKPDNVLLDTDFCPKIADFGMAKLLNRDFSRALTTMRGTIGYLAPEWISGLPITHKADVYSYGMMLLEIISGRRNSEKIKEGRHTYFPIYAACKVNEGDVMCLLDSRLKGNADAEQLEKACRIACWCIQDYVDQRPMMGQVVLMLEGAMDVLVPPIPRSLQNFVDMEDHSTDLDTF